MGFMCIQPGCGYIFPEGQRPSDKCPNCEKSPFDLEKGASYSKEELQARKQFFHNHKGSERAHC